MVLPSTSTGGARLLAEKVRRAVTDLGIPHEKPEPGAVLTVSIGVATLVPRIGQAFMQLVSLADQGLYMAKQAGRDQVGLVNDTSALS